jgi:hypothetical protein
VASGLVRADLASCGSPRLFGLFAWYGLEWCNLPAYFQPMVNWRLARPACFQRGLAHFGKKYAKVGPDLAHLTMSS